MTGPFTDLQSHETPLSRCEAAQDIRSPCGRPAAYRQTPEHSTTSLGSVSFISTGSTGSSPWESGSCIGKTKHEMNTKLSHGARMPPWEERRFQASWGLWCPLKQQRPTPRDRSGQRPCLATASHRTCSETLDRGAGLSLVASISAWDPMLERGRAGVFPGKATPVLLGIPAGRWKDPA